MEKVKNKIPPYVSFKTFQTFLEFLSEGMPNRIDRSVWLNKFSGSMQEYSQYTEKLEDDIESFVHLIREEQALLQDMLINEGDIVKVKVLDVDGRGKVKLSMKEVEAE